LREGNRKAWTALYEAYSGDVWRYVARLVGGDGAAVADVVQEVFIAAAKGARGFDASRGTLWGWLAGIAHRQVAAYWRQAARVARVQKLAWSAGEKIRGLMEEESPAKAMEERELADLVRSVLAELPADYAGLLTGKYLDELSLEELAEQTGGTVEGVKSKLARARKEFRGKFERMARDVVRHG
jgi:RNA polymerase sigma-70 factor (ECF subfamily)